MKGKKLKLFLAPLLPPLRSKVLLQSKRMSEPERRKPDVVTLLRDHFCCVVVATSTLWAERQGAERPMDMKEPVTRQTWQGKRRPVVTGERLDPIRAEQCDTAIGTDAVEKDTLSRVGFNLGEGLEYSVYMYMADDECPMLKDVMQRRANTPRNRKRRFRKQVNMLWTIHSISP